MNLAPPFLFKEGFDSRRDTPHFRFNRENQLLDRIRARLLSPVMKARIRRMDVLFDLATALLVVGYVLVQVLFLTAPVYLPLMVFVPLMVVLRLSLAGSGHYFNHRAIRGWNKLFSQVFDINYVAMAFVVVDGHTLMHHPHPRSDVDVKRNVFTAMMKLPRYYRLPLHTLHKLGHVLTGMFIRMGEICTYGLKYREGVNHVYGSGRRALPHYLSMISVKLLLFGELVLFWYYGELFAWFLQFLITIWISTFLIVASHDLDDEQTAEHPADDDDWAVFQIEHAYDLTLTGNRYIDCFLSSGLSPHRVHHVLPYQRSGFANIASEAIVREEAEKMGVVWEEPKNFLRERVPLMLEHYLSSSSRRAKEQHMGLLREHFSLQALRDCRFYIVSGFSGFGSI